MHKSKEEYKLDVIKQKKAEYDDLIAYYTTKLSSKPGSGM